MPYCAVANCTQSNRSAEGDSSISFFSFPKCERTRAEWVHKCCRADPMNLKTARICMKHFKEEDFDPTCLKKRSFGFKCRLYLKHNNVIPSVNLPSRAHLVNPEERERRHARRGQKKLVDDLLADQSVDTDDPTELNLSDSRTEAVLEEYAATHTDPCNVLERRKNSQKLRRERYDKKKLEELELQQNKQLEELESQVRKDRKELVDKLLSESEKEQNPAGNDAEPQRKISSIDLLKLKVGLKPGWPKRQIAQGLGKDAPAEPASGPVPVDSSSDDDDLAPWGGGSGGDEPDRSSAGAKGAKPNAGVSARPAKPTVKILPRPVFKTAASPHSTRTLSGSTMLVRTKELMQLKTKVRRLEAKCLRLLGGPTEPRAGAGAGGDAHTAGGKQTAGDDDRRAACEEETSRTGAVPALRTLGDGPLVILRNDRDVKMPPVVIQLRKHELPDKMATSMPLRLQEAQEENHQLKMQLLRLQAVMLKWAMKNKLMSDANQKRMELEGLEATPVRGRRLRELLQLEAAVKAMFTEAQLRHIIRSHDDSTGGNPTEKCKQLQWGEEDLRRMLELRAISSDKVLHHVREKMNIPLPTLRTAKLRCKNSPAVAEAYKDMVKKREENQNLCDMCEGQVKAIDRVIDAADDQHHKKSENSPFGRQYMQHVSQEPADASQKKRRRDAGAATSSSQKKKKKKKKKRRGASALDWDTSDSDAELSDPDLWDRVQSSRVSWQPDILGHGSPPGRQPLSSAPDPYGYGSAHRSWQ